MVNLKTPISMDAQSNGGNHANLKNDSSDAYGSYCLAIDIDKRKFDAPKSTEEMNGNVKTDDYVSVSASYEFNDFNIITWEDVNSRGFLWCFFLFGISLFSN